MKQRTKICSKCNIKKLLGEFHKKKDSKDGHQTQCKNCRLKYMRKRYENNSETIKQKTKEYNQKIQKK